MKLNIPIAYPPNVNYEGTIVHRIGAEKELRRTVLSCMLWEAGSFYEGGEEGAARIVRLLPQVNPVRVAALAVEAREKMKLRHVPLFICRETLRAGPLHRQLVAKTLERVIQRPDELAEFLAIYWKDAERDAVGRIVTPLANQAKKGLAAAFAKFDAYQLAKWNKDGAIKLRDVMFLTHPKPLSANTFGLGKPAVGGAVDKPGYKRGGVLRHAGPLADLAANALASPDTWEVALSSGKAKKETWERLLAEEKLGVLALLRNLRNMQLVGASDALIREALATVNVERALPFRFVAAARYAPTLEPALEGAMFRCLADRQELPGRTALVIDTSPSMWMARISAKSEMDRFDAAAALAILARELCEDVRVYAFNRQVYVVPPRRGFALRDALAQTKESASCGGLAVALANKDGYDRIVLLTDGQWHYMPGGGVWTGAWGSYGEGDAKEVSPPPLTGKAYMINVACGRNGVGYGKWISIDGWSEAVLDYVRTNEAELD